MKKTAEEIKVGKKYIIDADFNNGGIVEVVSAGNLYCVVRDNEAGAQWETMCHRLSDIPRWAQELVAAAPPPASEGEITDYWRKRCIAAEKVIDSTPYNPFISQKELKLYSAWRKLNSTPVPLATLPTREPEGWKPIDENNIPIGDVLLFTTSKVIVKGHWWTNQCGDTGFRTEQSTWRLSEKNEKECMSVLGLNDILFWQPLPSPPNQSPIK